MKVTLALFFAVFSFSSFAQEKGDVAFVLSSNDKVRGGFEYRFSSDNPYRMRLGIFYGTQYHSYSTQKNPTLDNSSDSLMTFRNFYNNHEFYNLSVGVERRLKESLFSVGVDLFLGYSNRELFQYNTPLVLVQEGFWKEGRYVDSQTTFPNHNDPNYPEVIGDAKFLSIKQQFFVPGASLFVNMDVPLNTAFLLFLGASYNLGIPIYMGTSRFIDHSDSYYGTPPSIIYMNLNAKIGLRYQIGVFKNRIRKTVR